MVNSTIIVVKTILNRENLPTGESCGNFNIPNKYSVKPTPIIVQIKKNVSRCIKPHCITKSAFDKNFNAKANSINPKTTLTEFNQPPD